MFIGFVYLQKLLSFYVNLEPTKYYQCAIFIKIYRIEYDKLFSYLTKKFNLFFVRHQNKQTFACPMFVSMLLEPKKLYGAP